MAQGTLHDIVDGLYSLRLGVTPALHFQSQAQKQ